MEPERKADKPLLMPVESVLAIPGASLIEARGMGRGRRGKKQGGREGFAKLEGGSVVKRQGEGVKT